MSLESARKRFPNMPDVEALPKGKYVTVYRFEGEEKTAGGLFVPDDHRKVRSRGILLAAGLQAMDELADALIEIGDEVTFAPFSGEDRETERKKAGQATQTLLECFVEDISSSVDALKRADDYDLIRSDGTDEYEAGTHYYRRKTSIKKGRAA